MDNITLLAKAFAEDVMNITADIMASNIMVNKKISLILEMKELV